MEKLVELLDHLHVTAEDMGVIDWWSSLLLDIIQSPEGTQCLSDWHWEPLVERAVVGLWLPTFGDIDALKIAKSLIDIQEWGKLECWIGILWTVSGREIAEEGMSSELGETAEGISSESEEVTEGGMDSQLAGFTEEDLEHPTLLLFHQRPSAAQRLEQWMERWSQKCGKDIPESLQRILTRVHEAARRQDAP